MPTATTDLQGQIIDCATCGHPHPTLRANTKYCHVCRLGQDLEWIRAKLRKCLVCEKKFAPITRGDSICSGCSVISSKHNVEGACRLCGTEEATLYNEDIHACLTCLHDRDKRNDLLKAVLLKIAWLKEHPPTEHDHRRAQERLVDLQPAHIKKRLELIASGVDPDATPEI